MTGTIHDAVANLPESVRQYLLGQWEHYGCMDVYDGVLDKYLLVLQQEAERIEAALITAIGALTDINETIAALVPKTWEASAPAGSRILFQGEFRRVFYLPESTPR